MLVLVICAACASKVPTDTQLQDLCRNVGFAVAGVEDEAQKKATFLEMMQKGSKEFDIYKITPQQIDLMFNDGGLALDGMLREWFVPVLEKKSQSRGEEGLLFTFYHWKYLPDTYGHEEVYWNAYKALLFHPDFREWFAKHEDYAKDIINGAARVGGDQWVDLGLFDGIVGLLKNPLPASAVFSSMDVFNTAFVSKKLSAEQKNEIRELVLGQYKALLGTERYATGRRREKVDEGIRYLESPYATGTLVGNTAPELDFIWISGGKEKSLADFQGKVVVLDFWATKCGPCIETFPHMRELREHYAAYPVEIVGVTSIMGYHVDSKNGKFISTDGKPEYEMDLMKGFMKDMGMTWRVAFSRQWVMNPDYGVLGIPHLTVLDADGKVRYNGIELSDLPACIDRLLKEKGMPVPGKNIDWELK